MGEDKEKNEGYSIYIPFKLNPGREISSIDESEEYKVGDYNVSLKKISDGYGIIISSFRNEESAKIFVSKLEASMHWVSLKHRTGIEFKTIFKDVMLFDEPLKPTGSPWKEMVTSTGHDSLDGFYNEWDPVIIPQDKCLFRGRWRCKCNH